jgi:hypothetical protein
MKKKTTSKTVDFGAYWEPIRIECTKLQALAHLIENLNAEGADTIDQRDIQWGIGMLLSQSIEKIHRISIQIEELDIQDQGGIE